VFVFQVLGLTTLQMVTLLSQAPVTPDGNVQYIQVCDFSSTVPMQ
jgi:hypothetical protein